MCLFLRRKSRLKSTRKGFTDPPQVTLHETQPINASTSPLLALPGDIRNRIYGIVVDWNVMDETGCLKECFTPPTVLPLTRQIYQEAWAVLLKRPLLLQTNTFNCALPFEGIAEQRVMAQVAVVVFPVVWCEKLFDELQLDCGDGTLWGPWEEYIVHRLTMVAKYYKTKQRWVFRMAGEEGKVKVVGCKVSNRSV